MVRDNSQTQQQAGMFANMPMQPMQPLPPAQPIPAPPNSVALPPGSIMTAQGQVLQPAAASNPYAYPPAAPSPYAPGYPPPYGGMCAAGSRSGPGACGNCPSCRVRGYR